MTKIQILKKENLKEAIEKLKNVDLEKVNQDEIIEIFNSFGYIIFQSVLFEPGRIIFRSRPAQYGEYYTKIEEISYPKKPPKIGRGSDGRQIFYGSVPTKNVKLGRIVSYVEVSNIWYEEDPYYDKESITCGRWIVKKPFRLAVIAHHNIYDESNVETKELHDKFKLELKEIPEIAEEALMILNFFAEEFSKKVVNQWEYKISAAVTEAAIQAGLGGVMYPSFQTEYKGLNVALTNDIVDNCLELEAVMGVDVFRKGKETISDNSLIASEFKDGKIIYKEVPFKDRIGNAKLNQFKEK